MKALKGHTPYEAINGRPPDLHNLSEWGCKVWIHDTKTGKVGRLSVTTHVSSTLVGVWLRMTDAGHLQIATSQRASRKLVPMDKIYIFHDLADCILLPMISNRWLVLENFNVATAQFVYEEVNPTNLGYVFSELAMFLHTQTIERRETYFKSWLKLVFKGPVQSGFLTSKRCNQDRNWSEPSPKIDRLLDWFGCPEKSGWHWFSQSFFISN